LVLSAPATERVILFEAEAKAVHQLMASSAARLRLVSRETLAGGRARRDLRDDDHQVGRGRWQGLTEELLTHELTAHRRKL
jgi:hypothetical protein